jgi:hypothetical protein
VSSAVQQQHKIAGLQLQRQATVEPDGDSALQQQVKVRTLNLLEADTVLGSEFE